MKVFRPSIIRVLCDTVAPAQVGDAFPPRRPARAMRIFSSAEYYLRVARGYPGNLRCRILC
jgi:hypothetical protein